MNRDEGSYQLSHIYDNLFAPKLSDERQLDRPFRRMLQLKPKRQQYKQESPADAVKPARRKSMQKLLQFDVFRFISPNSISPNFKV